MGPHPEQARQVLLAPVGSYVFGRISLKELCWRSAVTCYETLLRKAITRGPRPGVPLSWMRGQKPELGLLTDLAIDSSALVAERLSTY